MIDVLQTAHEGFNNAYILFSFILGVYAAYLGANGRPLSGNFWGAVWTNTGLAGMVLLVTIGLLVQGVEAQRVVYYLYQVYFIISLPGLFTILEGNDNRRAAFFFGVVAMFNSAAAYRAGSLLAIPWK